MSKFVGGTRFSNHAVHHHAHRGGVHNTHTRTQTNANAIGAQHTQNAGAVSRPRIRALEPSSPCDTRARRENDIPEEEQPGSHFGDE